MADAISTMTKRERVRAAIAGRAVDRVPASLWGHDFQREWSAEELVEATLEQYRAYDWDFIKLNPRATYFAEAWGNRYERPEGSHQPRLLAASVTEAAHLDGVRPADARGGVFGEHLRALRLLLDAVRDEVDVVHTVFSPLSVVAQLCGNDAPAFLRFAEERSSSAHAAIAAVTETLAAYARASVEEGASGIFFAPLSWASRDTCDDAFYAEFGRPYDLRVLAAVSGARFNILHVCRNHNMLEKLLDYPVAAFNWADRGRGNPGLLEIRARTEKAVMGGIDQTLLREMTPAEVASQAREVLSHGSERIFLTAGCAIPPETPAANRAAVAAAARGGRV
jgi:uroporphyrinogen decarboxylase